MLFLLATAKTTSPSEASPSEPYDSSFRQLIYIAYFITIENLYDLNIGHFSLPLGAQCRWAGAARSKSVAPSSTGRVEGGCLGLGVGPRSRVRRPARSRPGTGRREDGGAGRTGAEPSSPPAGAVEAADLTARRGDRGADPAAADPNRGRRRGRKAREAEGAPRAPRWGREEAARRPGGRRIRPPPPADSAQEGRGSGAAAVPPRGGGREGRRLWRCSSSSRRPEALTAAPGGRPVRGSRRRAGVRRRPRAGLPVEGRRH